MLSINKYCRLVIKYLSYFGPDTLRSTNNLLESVVIVLCELSFLTGRYCKQASKQDFSLEPITQCTLSICGRLVLYLWQTGLLVSRPHSVLWKCQSFVCCTPTNGKFHGIFRQRMEFPIGDWNFPQQVYTINNVSHQANALAVR